MIALFTHNKVGDFTNYFTVSGRENQTSIENLPIDDFQHIPNFFCTFCIFCNIGEYSLYGNLVSPSHALFVSFVLSFFLTLY